jgi:hypothetical protein
LQRLPREGLAVPRRAPDHDRALQAARPPAPGGRARRGGRGAGDVVTTAAAEPPPCRSLDAGGFSVRVAHQGAGCERVGRMVVAWSEARRCVSRTGRPRVCRVSGFSCAPVDGGRLRALAGAACLRERARVELTIRHRCGIVPVSAIESLLVTAVTTSCGHARDVARGYARREGCRDRRCTVGGWVCTPVLTGPPSRCARPQHPHEVLELTRQNLIVD